MAHGTITLGREQQRNLKKEIGATAAAAVGEVREVVAQISLQHRVLAQQMLEFERTVATVKEGRALDRARFEAFGEQLENFNARLDGQAARVTQLNRIWSDGLELERWRIARFENLTFWQRMWWNLTGGLPSGLDELQQASDLAYPGDGV